MDRLADSFRSEKSTGPDVKATMLTQQLVAESALDAGRTRIGCGELQTRDMAVRNLSGRDLSSLDAGIIRPLIAEAQESYRC